MKLKYILLFVLLSTPVFGFAQKKYSYEAGQRFIKKAKKNLANDNYGKTKKHIEKAKNSSGGYCGLGAIMTDRVITLLEYELLTKQKKYDELLILLDSAKKQSYGGGTDELDSLEVQTLILKYGKEKVKSAFGKVDYFEITQNQNSFFYINSVYLEELKYTFYFTFRYNQTSTPDSAKPKLFIKEAQNRPFYSLLKN
ncbi:hypothetical protein WAF17_19705 [Bernardetia sp. ABR2-2B]|uniref:hypothetical protein n=1 Tax=Bernardetia sp. ABR2-2B TaxID=3127472 RepID=UPI0030D085C1